MAKVFRTELSTKTFTLVLTFQSTLTRCLTGCIFALKAWQVLLVITGMYFLYTTPTNHAIARLTTKTRTWVTTV